MVEVKAASAGERIDTGAALSVGEVARRSGVAVSAPRFYEAKGLISGWRDAGNRRRYPRHVLRRVALTRVAQRAGLPLGAIRDALAGLPSGKPPSARDWRLATGWKSTLDGRIQALTRLRDEFEGCIGCAGAYPCAPAPCGTRGTSWACRDGAPCCWTGSRGRPVRPRPRPRT